jgi:Uma2 family endonuclease
MSTQPKSFITPEQYLQIEREAERKSEYHNGEMLLMAGASSDHNLIVLNLGSVFREQFRHRPSNVYAADMRVRVSNTGLHTYPDGILVCGEREWADASRTTLRNPAVIIEVLSESTEAYDRGDKFWNYRQLPSLQEYILVSQKAFRIDQFIRQPDGEFKLRSCSSIDDRLEIPTVGCSVPLKEIYFKTELVSG